MNSNVLCEACRNNVWTIVDDADISDRSVSAYHLCAECHNRLIFYALKPREWYNLAISHGSQMYYLHDDFYDDEGVAVSPKKRLTLLTETTRRLCKMLCMICLV